MASIIDGAKGNGFYKDILRFRHIWFLEHGLTKVMLVLFVFPLDVCAIRAPLTIRFLIGRKLIITIKPERVKLFREIGLLKSSGNKDK